MEKVKLEKGMTVKYDGGFYRISRLSKFKANLKAVFGSRIAHKGISVDEIVEAEAEFYAYWQTTEAYRCM